jgi:hypothetical protein
LDMDIILSPNDVFVFRVTDMDQDGNWELDQSLDPNNFMYTGHAVSECDANIPDNTGSSAPNVAECRDFSIALFPNLTGAAGTALDPAAYPNIRDQMIADQKAYGYIEFIGEAVLVGCDGLQAEGGEGCDLDGDGDNQNDWPLDSWVWSDDDRGASRNDAYVPVDGTLAGVGNWLSGQFWIALPGTAGTGVGGSAIMFRDFRTNSGNGTHRVDVQLYPFNSEVIVHNDNPAAADDAYIYRYPDGDMFEQHISFNNTWGPTLADGDDYDLSANSTLMYTQVDALGTAPTVNRGGSVLQPMQFGVGSGLMLAQDAYRMSTTGVIGADFWDDYAGFPSLYTQVNSIAEVELALNNNAQSFSGHFFDMASSSKGAGASPLMTAYFVHFPTKFYRGEFAYTLGAPFSGLPHYVNYAVDYLLSRNTVKVYDVEPWDTDENYQCIPGERSIVSPTVLDPGMTTVNPDGTTGGGGDLGFEVENCQWPFRYELNLVTIQELKDTHPNPTNASDINVRDFVEGQLNAFPRDNNLIGTGGEVNFRQSFPGLWYGFNLEIGSGGVGLRHWLPMHRSEWVVILVLKWKTANGLSVMS